MSTKERLQNSIDIINMRKKLCFETGQLRNMDEVPLTFDVPSNKTVDVKGAKTIMIKTSGNEKTHYTVVLACSTDGKTIPSLLTHWHIQTAVRRPDSRGRFLHSRLSDGLSHRCLFV